MIKPKLQQENLQESLSFCLPAMCSLLQPSLPQVSTRRSRGLLAIECRVAQIPKPVTFTTILSITLLHRNGSKAHFIKVRVKPVAWWVPILHSGCGTQVEKATGDWHCVYLKVSDHDGQARTPGMTLTTQAEHAHCTQPTSRPCHLTPPWDARQEPALACSAKLTSGTTSESPGCPPAQDH